MESNRETLWKPKSIKIKQKCHLDSNINKTCKINKKDAKTEAQHLQKPCFRFKNIAFLSFAASAKKC